MRILTAPRDVGELPTLRLSGNDVVFIDSDLHLGQFGASTSFSLKAESTIKPTHVVINGDLTHTRSHLYDQSGLLASEQMYVDRRNVQSRYTPTIWLPGDHDEFIPGKQKRPSILSDEIAIVPAIKIITSRHAILVVHGHAFDTFYGKGGMASFLFLPIYYKLRALAVKSDRAKLVIQSIKNHSIYRREFNTMCARAAAEAIAYNCNIVIIGHTHKVGIRRVFDKRTRMKVKVISPGGSIDQNFFAIVTNNGVKLFGI
ncbi:MAG: metallophosphoesterase [Patescibacteria group bacterium]